MASLFGLQKCILLWSKVVVTGCGRLWSVSVMSLEVLAINASIGNSKQQWINESMEDLSDGSMEELSDTSSPLSLSCSCSSFEHEEPGQHWHQVHRTCFSHSSFGNFKRGSFHIISTNCLTWPSQIWTKLGIRVASPDICSPMKFERHQLYGFSNMEVPFLMYPRLFQPP